MISTRPGQIFSAMIFVLVFRLRHGAVTSFSVTRHITRCSRSNMNGTALQLHHSRNGCCFCNSPCATHMRHFDLVRSCLLLAAQMEKDFPAGFGYLDHAFSGYLAADQAGFMPERRISRPMDGAYRPRQIRQRRARRFSPWSSSRSLDCAKATASHRTECDRYPFHARNA